MRLLNLAEYALVIGLLICVAASSHLLVGQASGAPDTGRSSPPHGRTQASPGRVRAPEPDPETCRQAQTAIGYYRHAYTGHREHMGLPGAVPRVWYQDCAVARRRATEWRDRAKAERVALERWRHDHYAWWDWMPRGWQNIGACETGYGKRPGDFRWNSGTYQGFAGFYHGSWDAFVSSADQRFGPYPNEAYAATPRQQYEVALAIWRRYGLTGWGCRGAFSR